MAATSCSPSCDRFNALLIAVVQGTKPACCTVYSFHTHTHTHTHTFSHRPPPFSQSPIRKPTIHFSWRSGMIMPWADWTHLSSAHIGRMARLAGRKNRKWMWYKDWTSMCLMPIICLIDALVIYPCYLFMFICVLSFFHIRIKENLACGSCSRFPSFIDGSPVWMPCSVYSHVTWLFQVD